MGNPEILRSADHRTEPSVSSAMSLAELVGSNVLHSVYCLRDRGEKLSKAAVIATRKTGYLSVFTIPTDGTLSARLEDQNRTTLAAISHVRLKHVKRGGMLLHGRVLCSTRKEVLEVPQAWWCVVNVTASGWSV